MRRRGIKSIFISSFPLIIGAGISTWHSAKGGIGCYGVNGPVPLAVLDKKYI
jgi:hypothetical protein